METQSIIPQQNEAKKKVFTHGKTTVFISHIGAAVIGGAVGAIISGKPDPEPIPPKPAPGKDVKPDTKPDTNADTVDKKDDQPPKDTGEKVRNDEPVPTDSTVKSGDDNPAEKTEKKDAENQPTDNKKTEDEKDIAQNPEQEEIDKIAENLINDSRIDERDIADVGSMLEGSYPVVISLDNGLEIVGFPFNDCGLDLVLVDLDGDGVYGDVLADINGELMRFDMPVTLSDGSVIGYDELIATLHITNSDIEQLLNDDPENNLTMTNDDRQRLEADNPEEDIVNWEKPSEEGEDNKETPEQMATGALTAEEEDELLRDILGENSHSDDEMDDGELTALLTGTSELSQTDDEEDIDNGDLDLDDLSLALDNPEL